MKNRLTRTKEYAELPSAARALALSPDKGSFAVGLRDGSVLTWGIDGQLFASQSVHLQAIYDVCWHPGGRVILSCGADRTVRVLDADTLDCVRVIAHPGDSIRSVRWSPQQDLLCWGAQDGRLQVLESYAVKWEREEGPPVRQVRWNPSGDLIAVCSDSSGLEVLRVPPFEWVPLVEQAFGALICVAEWVNDTALVLGSTSGEILVVDVHSAQVVANAKCHHAAIAAISIHEDGQSFASRARDGTIEVFSLPELRRLRTARVSVGEYVPPILEHCGHEIFASDKSDSIVVALAEVDDKTNAAAKVFRYRVMGHDISP